jgi:hypothetical protein
MRVDEAVVINLPTRPDRLARLHARLPRPWPLPNPRVHPGVQEPAPPWFASSDGAWGCRQAHLQILERAWHRSIDATLVLEDDVVFAPDFTQKWADLTRRLPANWDMVMLGGQHIEPPAPAGSRLVLCTNTRRTHAYIVRLKAIPLLMRTWRASSRHIDHALSDFQAATWVYAPSAFIVGQDAGYSDISSKNNPQIRFWT